jgi:translation initiation factor 6 (eIF-6)
MATPSLNHWLPLAALEVRVVLLPWQKILLPLMAGVATCGSTCTATVAGMLVQPFTVTATE